MSHPGISIIIPALNEESVLPDTLDALQRLDAALEIIVVDGGSSDRTVELALRRNVRVVGTKPGRGLQLHAGAHAATRGVLWFLHADTRPAADAASAIRDALGSGDVAGGNFQLIFSGTSGSARLLTWLYPRLRLLGLSYGDSGIFVRREVYHRLGGFRPYPLFEDLDFLRRLRRQGRFVHLDSSLVTSSRRFEGRSFTAAFARWTVLQMLYWIGVSPWTLARYYVPVRAPQGSPPPTP